MATEHTFRRALRELGYRIRRHGNAFDLIDLHGEYIVLEDSTIENIAEYIAYTHFPPPGR